MKYILYTILLWEAPIKPNKKQNCYDALIERILTLELEPGLLLDETLLSERYELSRTPLREVFQKLAGEGYITLTENRGAKVSSMDIKNMRNFFQSAPMIYAAVARLAAENASAKQIEQLKITQQSFRRNGEAGEPEAMAILNHAFHRLIGEMANNAYLMPSINRLLIDHTRMSQSFYAPNNSSERQLIWEACDQHDLMIEAIESREPALAVQLTLEHWALSRDQIEKYARPDPLPIDFELDADSQGTKHAV